MIHLKVKTEYSFGQTFAPMARMIDRLKELGVTAAGIVDTDSTWGHVPWVKACTKAGIQPLLGVEVCVSDTEVPTRMWFLARTTHGLGLLYGALSKAHQQPLITNAGRLPRLYRHDVERLLHADGGTHCYAFAGQIADGAWLKANGIFVDYNPASSTLNFTKAKLAKTFGLVEVTTADNAYAAVADRATFELVSRAGLKPSPQHLIELTAHQQTAQRIAESCKGCVLPKAPMVRSEGNLEALCRQGIKFRKRTRRWTKEYETRLQYELGLIRSKDFESYFLIVADMCQFAKQHMLVGPSRGSAAGSLVCYLTRITEIDPIPPKLFFERFIDVTRTDLPDIDLDFPDNKREMVFEYMVKKYGAANVSHIGTISRFKPKSALIEVCKALNIPPTATAAVKVAMIERSSADARASNCLEDTFNTTSPGRQFIANYPQAAIASTIEGHASHTGVHAAGLLVSSDDITKYAVVDQYGIAHIEKDSAEHLGLLKIDVLGLRTLGILEDAGVPIDWYGLTFDDPATFKVFNEQRLCSIFQFEGQAMRSVALNLNIKSLNEVDAVTALARPGPFSGGVTQKYLARAAGEPYTPIYPLVEAHMKETYGLPIYQEQTLAIVRAIGKFDWKETSTIRKAMSKRMGKEFFDSYWEKFKVGATSQGIPERDARTTWELINGMGSWQMNKAHTYSYAVISYWTAYLKAHFPLEFAAANMRHAKSEDSAIELLREMVREGIQYEPFNIQRSELNWSVKDGKLVEGFVTLHGIGEITAKRMLAARQAGTLSGKDLEKLKQAESHFKDLFPLNTKYQALYANPEAAGIASPIVHISELLKPLPHGAERVFIAELVHKNPRNANEEAEIKKRNGRVETGQLEYLDLRFRDDSGTIGGRVGRRDYLQIGVEIVEKIPVGAQLLIRAQFYNGITYAFVKKWRRLDGEPIIQKNHV